MSSKSLDRPAFLRPVEITTDNQNVTVDSTLYTIPVGIYASVLHVMKELDDQLGGTYDFRVFAVSGNDGELRSRISNASTMTVTWTDPDLATLLGFATTPLSGSTLYTSPDTPQHTWIPNYVPANRDGWKVDQRKIARGKNSAAGNWVGVKPQSDRYLRDFEFVHEPSENILRTHAGDAIEGTKTFEEFAIQARSATASTPQGVSLKGFYIVHRIEDASSTASWVSSTDNGGINIDYDTDPDLYTFAAFHGDRIGVQGYSLPKSYQRMSVNFSCITAAAPSWA